MQMQQEPWHKSILEISNTELQKKLFVGFFQANWMEYYIFEKKYPMLAHAVMLSHSDVVGA